MRWSDVMGSGEVLNSTKKSIENPRITHRWFFPWGYKPQKRRQKYTLKNTLGGIFRAIWGHFFWGLNSIDGGSLKTQLLLRRATRGWKSESVSKIGESDGRNIIIFITIQRAVIIFWIPMPFAKIFCNVRMRSFSFTVQKEMGPKGCLHKYWREGGVCIQQYNYW